MAISTTNALTAVADGAAICPLWIEVSLEDTEGLRQRARSTVWPEKEIVADQFQGKRPGPYEGGRASGEIRGTGARRGLASAGQPTAALASMPDDPRSGRVWVVAAFLLGPIARYPQAVSGALQHALDLAGPNPVVVPFLSHPRPEPPGSHDWHPSAGTTLIGQAMDLLARPDGQASPAVTPARDLQALTYGETRVLRYLPTNLSAQEIAGELCLSVNTVKTHQRHLYQKLGAHCRTRAVEQARALGLLASLSCRREQHVR